MLDLTEAPSAKLLEPTIRLSIENAAAELCSLVKIVKLARDLDDDTLDKLASQGDALLDRIAKYRAVSLDDVLLKLELWRGLPADLWNNARVIESVTVDLEELRHLDAIRASDAWPTTPPPVHGAAPHSWVSCHRSHASLSNGEHTSCSGGSSPCWMTTC
jgi:hypothetical protein